MTRSEMVEQLKNEYRRRRMQAEQEQDARVREVERADPQIHALWAKQARLLNDAVRAMVARTPDAQEKAARMREEGQAVLAARPSVTFSGWGDSLRDHPRTGGDGADAVL